MRPGPRNAGVTVDLTNSGPQDTGQAGTDTLTNIENLRALLNVVVHSADVPDRDAAFHLLRGARRLFPFITRIFADGGYAGIKMAMVVWRTGAWRLEIVKRSETAGFEVLPKRWIVERTFAWISRNRRFARDFERYAATVGFRPPSHDPHHAQAARSKSLIMNPNFPDGLLRKSSINS
jgi:putative transposase